MEIDMEEFIKKLEEALKGVKEEDIDVTEGGSKKQV